MANKEEKKWLTSLVLREAKLKQQIPILYLLGVQNLNFWQSLVMAKR